MFSRDNKWFRTLGKVLFVLYIVFLIYFLFLSDWYGREGVMDEYRYNLQLFKEIRRFIVYREQLGAFAVFSNLFGNILIFMPFGFFLEMTGKKCGFFTVLFGSLGLSLCVEVCQLVTRVGSFDVDDIFLNTAGGVLGFAAYSVCSHIRRKYAGKKEE